MSNSTNEVIERIMKKYQHQTKHSHFVKQEYLMKWSSNNKNILVSINSGDFHKDIPRNVCHERYMYKLEALTNQEMTFLKSFYVNLSPAVKKANDDFLNEWQLCCTLAKEIKNQDIAKKMLIQAGEDLQTNYESAYSEKIQGDLLNCKEAFLHDCDEKLNFCIFLFSQYLRTQKMKDKIEKNYLSIPKEKKNTFELDPNRIWKVLITLLTNAASYKLFDTPNIHIKFIKNNENSFITSDQPIININTNEQDNIKFYFPVSPSLAIIFPNEKYETVFADKKIVEKYNRIMKLESNRFIVGYYNCNKKE